MLDVPVLTLRPFVETFNADYTFPEKKAVLSIHVPTPTTTVVRMMSEKHLLGAVALWPETRRLGRRTECHRHAA